VELAALSRSAFRRETTRRSPRSHFEAASPRLCPTRMSQTRPGGAPQETLERSDAPRPDTSHSGTKRSGIEGRPNPHLARQEAGPFSCGAPPGRVPVCLIVSADDGRPAGFARENALGERVCRAAHQLVLAYRPGAEIHPGGRSGRPIRLRSESRSLPARSRLAVLKQQAGLPSAFPSASGIRNERMPRASSLNGRRDGSRLLTAVT